jgi:hypothetical protein
VGGKYYLAQAPEISMFVSLASERATVKNPLITFAVEFGWVQGDVCIRVIRRFELLDIGAE